MKSDSKDINIGRWRITQNGIETNKENNKVRDFDINDLWSFERLENGFVYSLPIYIMKYGWISNVDLLYFNSAFLIGQELFSAHKPQDLPNISWLETLKMQYDRFENSLDINSDGGRKQFEYRQEYYKELSFEAMARLAQIKPGKD